MFQWTVVEFLNDSREISTVPIKWLKKDADDNMVCSWPSNKIRKNIKNATTPQTEWEEWPVQVLLEKNVSYQQAISFEKTKEKEEDEQEKEDIIEQETETRKRKRKSLTLDEYEYSDFEVSEIIPPPPRPPKSVVESSQVRTTKDSQSTSLGFDADKNENSTSHENCSALKSPSWQRRNAEQEKSHTIGSADTLSIETIGVSQIEQTDKDLTSFSNNDFGETLTSILKTVTENKILLDRILKGISSNKLSDNDKVSNVKTVPTKQFRRYKSLVEYENFLKESQDAQKELELVYYICGGGTEKENIRRGLKRIFSDKLATKCSLYGRKGNYAIGNFKIIELLKTAVRKNFNKLSDKDFELSVGSWFRQAGLRYERGKKHVTNNN